MSALRFNYFQSKVTSIPTLVNLPVEITLRIWQLLDPETLIFVGSICRRWYQLSKDSFFWRSMVEAYQKEWKSYTGCGPTVTKKRGFSRLLSSRVNKNTSTKNPIGGATTDWRRCFAEQIFAQNKLNHQRQRMPHTFSAPVHRDHRVYRIPIFGSGMGSSAKTFLYPLLWDKSSPLTRTELYPGTLGIGSGLGFRIGPKEVNFCALYCYRRELLEAWRSFLSKSQGCIFVINPRYSEENLARARGLLHALLYDGNQKPIMHGPLLVVGIPPAVEKPEVSELPSMSALDLVRELQIERLPCSAYHVVLLHELYQSDWTTTHFALRWLVASM